MNSLGNIKVIYIERNGKMNNFHYSLSQISVNYYMYGREYDHKC